MFSYTSIPLQPCPMRENLVMQQKEKYWNNLQSRLVRSLLLAVFTKDYDFPVFTAGTETSGNGKYAPPVSADVVPDTK